VVLATADSNVYVSALQFGGTPRQLLIAARARTFNRIPYSYTETLNAFLLI